MAIDNAPKFENKRGNRFEVPRPDDASVKVVAQSSESSAEAGRPQILTDGNANPLIKIDGNSATIWQYTLATLSSLNHTVVGQSKNAYEATVKVDKKTYVLKLTSVGASNNLAVFNTDNSFADKEVAVELLTQIYQNWPA